MATVLVDAGFLVALLCERERLHGWSIAAAKELPPPWVSCESALSEAYHLLGSRGGAEKLAALLERGAVRTVFHLEPETVQVLSLLRRYANVPMSLADACLVRMTEILPDPLLLTTDSDFRVYRRHGRKVVPTRLPHGR